MMHQPMRLNRKHYHEKPIQRQNPQKLIQCETAKSTYNTTKITQYKYTLSIVCHP